MSPGRRRRDLVRSFVLTDGRARPSRPAHELDLITMVTAAPDRPATGLQPEQAAMVKLCIAGQMSVAEIAGHLQMPLTVTRVLLADLLDSGHLVLRSTPAAAQTLTGASDDERTHILGKVLDGLRAL